MSTQRWQDVLGFDEPDGKTNYLGLGGRTTTSVPRVDGEYTDQSAPASDMRRGGTQGSAGTEPAVAEPSHDGYGGRGTGQKYTHPTLQ